MRLDLNILRAGLGDINPALLTRLQYDPETGKYAVSQDNAITDAARADTSTAQDNALASTAPPPPPPPTVVPNSSPTINPLLNNRLTYNAGSGGWSVAPPPVFTGVNPALQNIDLTSPAPVLSSPSVYAALPPAVQQQVPAPVQLPTSYNPILVVPSTPAPPPAPVPYTSPFHQAAVDTSQGVFTSSNAPIPVPPPENPIVYAGGSPGGPIRVTVTDTQPPAPTPTSTPPAVVWTPLSGEDPNVCTGPSVINPATGLPCDQLPPHGGELWTGPGIDPSPQTVEQAYQQGQLYQTFLDQTGMTQTQGQVQDAQDTGASATTTATDTSTTASTNPIWDWLNQTVFGIPYWMIGAGVLAWMWFGRGEKKGVKE